MGQLPQIWPNPVKILAGAGFGRISKKGPDAGFAGAGAEIRYIPTKNPVWCKIFGHICHISRVMANFVLKFPNSRYHGNRGRCQKIFFVHRT